MNEKLLKLKIKLIESGQFKRVNTSGQYSSQICPYCGDRKSHFYVYININDDSPIKYNCFKCPASGILNQNDVKFFEFFNISPSELPKNLHYRKNISTTKVSNSFELTVNENDDITNISEYIHNRIGEYPTLPDLQSFQYIGNPISYSKKYIGNKNDRYFMNRYWFKLTSGNMIGRYKDDNNDHRWLKHFQQNKSNQNVNNLYSIKTPVDLYCPINVYIAEGIFDIIGLYYNYKRNNNIYIACLGNNYESALRYILKLGLFGKSVNINIFKDSNIRNVYVNKNLLKLFNKYNVYQNMGFKDYGITKDKFDIQKII